MPSKAARKEYYQKTIKQIFEELKTSKRGLSTHEAGHRLAKYGLNEIPGENPPSSLGIFLYQFKSPLIYILVIAAVITIFLRDFADTVIIGIAVAVNTILGFLQEYKAQNAIYALKKIFAPKAASFRSNKLVEIESKYLVPGDIVSLQAGQKVPADCRLIEINDLSVNESALTGESYPVGKLQALYKSKKDLGDIRNMVFWGTEVVGGNAKAVVVKTGVETELGKIAESLKETREEKTPLQKKLSKLAKSLAVIVLTASLLIFIVGVLAKRDPAEMFVTSVALAVAAVPEGLVVSLTVILAIGMQRIFKKRALVRKLVAAETLGSVTVICTDKTGTLTEGHMRVVDWKLTDFSMGVKAATLCNDLGNPTEVALWERLRSIDNYDPQKIKELSERISEIPFSSEKKYMAVLYNENGNKLIYAKGAPEVILNWCKLGIKERKKWEDLVDKWGAKGLRVLALASKYAGEKVSKSPKDFLHSNLEYGFTLLGLVAFADPVREEARDALDLCRKAGIKVAVITGDYKATAQAVMGDLGIKVKEDEILDGETLDKINERDLRNRVSNIKLFARVSPSNKLKIVNALKNIGEIVAMTGDGVNDAPALKSANIGIVVGTATEVARETADMVLLDSNFKTIVDAVEEGRGIFDNIRKVALYLLSDSFSEIVLILGSIVLRMPLPLTAAQILWVNLITDGFPDLALTVDPRRKDIMKEPPKNPDEHLLNMEVKSLIFIISVLTGVTSLLLFYIFLKLSNDLSLARSITFAVLGVDSLFYVFSCRNLRKSIFHDNQIFSNKYLLAAVSGGLFLQFSALYYPILRNFLGVEFLNIYHWIIVLMFSFIAILAIEMVKFIFNRKH